MPDNKGTEMNELREDIIRRYVDAYNHFDVDGMVRDLADTIYFENVSNGETNLVLDGLDAFRKQAEQMKDVFSKRKQTIRSVAHQGDEVMVEIEYHAVLATDLPNGMKRGDELSLKGKSIFRFERDKIISIRDIS